MSSPRARRSARAFNERASAVSSKSAVGDGPSSSSSAHPVPPVVLGNDDTARVSTGSCPPCVTRVKPTSNPEGNEDPWSSSFWVWRGLLATTVPPGTGGIAGPTTPFRRSRSAAAGLCLSQYARWFARFPSLARTWYPARRAHSGWNEIWQCPNEQRMLTPPARPHATQLCRDLSFGMFCTPRTARTTSESSTCVSGIQSAHATWHHLPS
mmetsp:Transcript_8546/g.32001  ORF Transcript_8546/g.32001 Transcript_8546/m.32001 type:complete len:210 (-) Transcript_8546:1012-1641(-)